MILALLDCKENNAIIINIILTGADKLKDSAANSSALHFSVFSRFCPCNHYHFDITNYQS